MYSLRRIPVGICVLFAADVALVVAPVLDYLIGSPFSVVRNWLSLDSEFSLPAWYSSMQWLCAAVLFGLIPAYLWTRRLPGALALAALALLFLAFSIDEILGIHEWLGRQSDALLPDGQRDHTVFSRTGVWPIVIVWAGYDLAVVHGFALSIQPPPPVEARAPALTVRLARSA